MKKLLSILKNLSLSTIVGLLSAYAGADNSSKIWRRLAIPLIITSVAYLQLESILVLTILSMCGVFSLGYGIPGDGDKGSGLGRFWYKLTMRNHLLSDILTRGTVAIALSCSLLSIPIITKEWYNFLIGSLLIILINSTLSYQNWGRFSLFGTKLCWSDFINYGLISFIVFWIIL